MAKLTYDCSYINTVKLAAKHPTASRDDRITPTLVMLTNLRDVQRWHLHPRSQSGLSLTQANYSDVTRPDITAALS